MSNCERCECETSVTTCSMFNTETICMACKKRERQHPAYAAAAAAEASAVQHGDYNFAGVGCPPELYGAQPEANSTLR